MRLLLAVMFLLLFLNGYGVVENCAAAPAPRTDRPRVLMDAADLVRVKDSISTYGREDFRALRNYAQRRLLSEPTGRPTQAVDPVTVAIVALIGLVGQDERLTRLAVDYAVHMGTTEPGAGDDTAQRNRLLSMAYVYDWLHDRMSGPEKSIVQYGIIAHIRLLNSFLEHPLYTGGHSRYGSATIMAGLIALSEEDWPGERGRLLAQVETQWEKGYNPFQSFVATEGGYHMGWRYGPAYTDPLPYLLWEKGTGSRWGDAWRREQIYWLIYGLRGDGTLPRSGDCWDSSPLDQIYSDIAATSSGLFRNRHAEWFFRTEFARAWEPRLLFRLLFRDPSVESLPPDDPAHPLPLARSFPHAGFVVARDSWGKDSTHLVFKSAPFYTRNHHHKDQNHFELSYKGSLLIDSGFYDYFGSTHGKNYYTRSIAHNTLVVQDETEKFLDGAPVSNDGGQRFMVGNELPAGREPLDLSEARSEKYLLGGITGFSSSKNAAWMRGDASRAYGSQKVTSYVRDILTVNRPVGSQHPYVVILDRVQLAKSLTPTILFHSNEKPVLTGNRFEIVNRGGGVLHGMVAASGALKLELVGGQGKEWWVDGKNYPPQSSWAGRGVDAGSWRVEASSQTRLNTIEFVTFLAVGDVKESKGAPQAHVIMGDGYAGAIVEEGLYLVFTRDKAEEEWRFAGPQFERVRKIYVGGLPGGRGYRFVVNGRVLLFSGPDVVFAGEKIPDTESGGI